MCFQTCLPASVLNVCFIPTSRHSLTKVSDHLFNLKFAVKELERNSKRCDKDERSEKNKVKQVGSSSLNSRDGLHLLHSQVCFSLHFFPSGHPEGKHGGCQDPRGEFHSPKASVPQLPEDERSRGRRGLQGPVCNHHEPGQHIIINHCFFFYVISSIV